MQERHDIVLTQARWWRGENGGGQARAVGDRAARQLMYLCEIRILAINEKKGYIWGKTLKVSFTYRKDQRRED